MFASINLCYDKAMDTKLIILRGSSGSGKSTVAKKLREQSEENIAIIEQDYLRREVLRECRGRPRTHNADLIYQTVMFCLERGFHVILEGNFVFDVYKDFFLKLNKQHPNNTFYYYFNISLEETIKRHQTKPKRDEFTGEQMARWYKENDIIGFPGEKIITDDFTLEATVALIKKDTGL